MLTLVQYYNQQSIKEFNTLSFNLVKDGILNQKQYETKKRNWKREYKKEVKKCN